MSYSNQKNENNNKLLEKVEFLKPVYGGDFLEIKGKIIQSGSSSRQILFEAFKIITSSGDINQESALDLIEPPVLVAKAIGTTVVTKNKQRKDHLK